MRRKTRFILLETGTVMIAISILAYFMIPRFLDAQNINTPRCIPDPLFRAFLEEHFQVEPGSAIAMKQVREMKVLALTPHRLVDHLLSPKNAAHFIFSPTEYNRTMERITARLGTSKIPLVLNDLQYFDHLEELYCSSQSVSKLDISMLSNLKILECASCGISSLDLTRNPHLQLIDCPGNSLTHLDISQNPRLTVLNCRNNQLSELDISKNPMLTRLDCSKNRLKSIDVSHNLQLTHLDVSFNQLTRLPDLRQHGKLEALSVEFNLLGKEALPIIADIRNRFTGEWSILGDKVYRGFLYEEQQNGIVLKLEEPTP